MKHEPLVVVASMLGPLVLRDPIHLDGVLLAAREKRDGIAARGTPFPALARRGAVFAASAGLLVSEGLGGIQEETVTRTKRLDMKRDGASIRLPDDGGTKATRTIQEMSPYRNRMVTERVLGNVRYVVWQALGDAAAIEDLLAGVSFLGKQYATGWGEVDGFEILPCDAQLSTCGLVFDGGPARNMPVGMLAELGIAGDVVVTGRVEPPYGAQHDVVSIAMPSFERLKVSEDRAREAFAY
jgi:hypothetical protein